MFTSRTVTVSKEYEYYMKKHYNKLIGHRILDYYLDSSDSDVDPFPVLVTTYKNKFYNVVIQRDPEGNGGGFCNIIEVENK